MMQEMRRMMSGAFDLRSVRCCWGRGGGGSSGEGVVEESFNCTTKSAVFVSVRGT